MLGHCLIVLAWACMQVSACSCAPRAVCDQLATVDYVAQGVAIQQGSEAVTNWIQFRVTKNIKGYLTIGKVYMVKSSASEASCGITMPPLKVPYVLSLHTTSTPDEFIAVLCDFQSKVSGMPKVQYTTVMNYPRGCMTCPGGKKVAKCKVDPCLRKFCKAVPTATCQSSNCGGCFATFYVNNNPVKC